MTIIIFIQNFIPKLRLSKNIIHINKHLFIKWCDPRLRRMILFTPLKYLFTLVQFWRCVKKMSVKRNWTTHWLHPIASPPSSLNCYHQATILSTATINDQHHPKLNQNQCVERGILMNKLNPITACVIVVLSFEECFFFKFLFMLFKELKCYNPWLCPSKQISQL